MYPELFRIGDFPITTFGLMMFLAFIAGGWVTGMMLRRFGLKSDLIWEAMAWIAIAGVVGAKLYFLALHWEQLVANPRQTILAREGLVWYGGLIGGVTAYYLQIRARRLPVGVMFDATAPALMLAIALGRIGCFLVGDDYGVYTDGSLGVVFKDGIPPSTAGYLRSVGDSIPSAIPDSALVPVHPTQLYEVFITLILFAFLWRLAKRRLKPGQLFAAFMALYSIERFMIEFVRAKGDRFIFGLTTSQMMSIFLFIAATILWNRQRSKADWNPRTAPAHAALNPNPA
jgi:phosphatidylglycerol:prolipoprotein diacylglycerol transferase